MLNVGVSLEEDAHGQVAESPYKSIEEEIRRHLFKHCAQYLSDDLVEETPDDFRDMRSVDIADC